MQGSRGFYGEGEACTYEENEGTAREKDGLVERIDDGTAQSTTASQGWHWMADDGIEKYNKIYDLVEIDHQLRGDSFNQELLKVHQKRHQENKKTTEQNNELKASKKATGVSNVIVEKHYHSSYT